MWNLTISNLSIYNLGSDQERESHAKGATFGRLGGEGEILRSLESLRMTGVVGIGREKTCHSERAVRRKNLGGDANCGIER